jgi:hypothetical protein
MAGTTAKNAGGDRRRRRQCRTIGVMTFARIGAVVSMRVEDYFANGKRVADGSKMAIAAVHRSSPAIPPPHVIKRARPPCSRPTRPAS